MGASTQVVAATHLSTLSCTVLTLRTLSMLHLPKMKSTRMRRSPKIKYRPEKKKMTQVKLKADGAGKERDTNVAHTVRGAQVPQRGDNGRDTVPLQ